MLRLAPAIAPIQVAVFPLMTRDGLGEVAISIAVSSRPPASWPSTDDSGAIGRRYRRQDEIGTPFAVTVDYDTLEDGTVTLRDRDSMRQVRLPRASLSATCRALCSGEFCFVELE